MIIRDATPGDALRRPPRNPLTAALAPRASSSVTTTLNVKRRIERSETGVFEIRKSSSRRKTSVPSMGPLSETGGAGAKSRVGSVLCAPG